MMRQIKFIKGLFVAFLLLFPFSSWAYAFEYDGIYYNIIGTDEVSVTYKDTSYDSYSGKITIPETVTNNGTPYNVTAIGNCAFRDCTGLTSVTIGENVTTIGELAFRDCEGLTSVTIPTSVTTIGAQAFSYCTGLTGELIIPDNVTSIGWYAFEHCTGLTSLTISNNVETISYEFQYCTGLTEVTIGSGTIEIYAYAFRGCPSLTKINVAEDNKYFSTQDGVLYSKDMTVLKLCPGGNVGVFEIPEFVTTIGRDAFIECTSLTSVSIPNSVITIDIEAFYQCTGLTSLTIPESVTLIGDGAFSGCTGLESMTIPNSVTSIQHGTFEGCTGLTSVTIGENVTYIKEDSFRDCEKLTEVTIPNKVIYIEEEAFRNCTGLTILTLGETMTDIGDGAFGESSKLKEIYSKNTTPPTISSSTFRKVDKEACIVYVPYGCTEIYSTTAYWKDFFNIKEIDTTGIDEVGVDREADATEVARYTIDGRQISTPQKGVNIILYSDGSVKKVFEK